MASRSFLTRGGAVVFVSRPPAIAGSSRQGREVFFLGQASFANGRQLKCLIGRALLPQSRERA
jgi:hypothetical protein